MNPFQKLKFTVRVANALETIQQGIEMKKATKIFAGIIGLASIVLQAPAAQQAVGGFFGAHPNVSAILGGVAGLLALFHRPAPAQS